MVLVFVWLLYFLYRVSFPSLLIVPFPVLDYTVRCPIKAENNLWKKKEKLPFFSNWYPQMEEMTRDPLLFFCQPSVSPAAMYCTLITTAWLKKSQGLAGETGTLKITKTPSAKKMAATSWETTEDLGRGLRRNKTYLPGQRAHHHPLGLYL